MSNVTLSPFTLTRNVHKFSEKQPHQKSSLPLSSQSIVWCPIVSCVELYSVQSINVHFHFINLHFHCPVSGHSRFRSFFVSNPMNSKEDEQSFRCLNNSLSLLLLLCWSFNSSVLFFVGLQSEEQLIALLVNLSACQLLRMDFIWRGAAAIQFQ